MRILFLGSHTLGVRSLDTLAKHAAIVGVVAHPDDSGDDGSGESVYEHAAGAGLSVARFRGSDPELERYVRGVRPDLIWIAGYRYLLPQTVLELAPRGAVNLHASLLPLYRGQSPLHWAITNGENEVGLSVHFVEQGINSGPLIAQGRIALSEEEDVGGALEKLYPLCERLSREVIAALSNGAAQAKPQAPGNWPIWPRLRPEHYRIDWSADSESIVNLVRAAARPCSGAFSSLEGGRITIWKARAGLPPGPGSSGSIWRVEGDRFFVNCGEGSLEVIDFDAECARRLRVGDRLEPLERAA